MTKLWLLDFNYFQNNSAQWKNLRVFLGLLDTITGYLLLLLLLWLLLSLLLLLLFVYLISFIANEFLLATVYKNFSNFKSFKIVLTCRISPPEVFSRKGVFCRCAENFRDVSVHGYDFNKFAKQLCCDRASVLVYSIHMGYIWVSFMSGGIFLGEQLRRTAYERT